MPTYNVKYAGSDDIEEVIMSYTRIKQLEAAGELSIIPSSPLIVSGYGTAVSKIDNGFNDVLQHIKKSHRGSRINTK